MKYTIKGQKKLVATEEDFEEVVLCVENDVYVEPVKEVWRGKTKIFDSGHGWYKDKLTEEERDCVSKVKTFYGVDVGVRKIVRQVVVGVVKKIYSDQK
jgi:hypothetical protein